MILGRDQKPLNNAQHHLNVFEIGFKQRRSFLEYVMGGCEINLAVAIDFTLSNGRQTSPSSLHSVANL